MLAMRQIPRKVVLLALVAWPACSGTDHRGGQGSGGQGAAGAGAGAGANLGRGTGGNGPDGSGAGGVAQPGAGSGGAGGSTAIGDPLCQMGVPETSQVPRMSRRAYDTVLRDLLGVTTLARAGNVPPSELLAPDSDGSLTDVGWNGYLTAADMVAAEVISGPNQTRFINCDAASPSCLMETIKSFGRKAFRRPMTDSEVTSFMRLDDLTPKGTPSEVAEAILAAFLSSPSFILLPELGQDLLSSTGAIALTSYEVATRLSFLLWESIPDDTLNTEADHGRLSTTDQIVAQARRMLKSDKASALAKGFHASYLGIMTGTHWFNSAHDGAQFPKYSSAARDVLEAELDSFFVETMLKGGAFKDLFLSTAAFVNRDTAPLYDLEPATFDTKPMRVDLDPTRRPGILTRAAFLSSFSYYDDTSPFERGGFIVSTILGLPFPGLDPTGPTVPPAMDFKTNREAATALTSPAACQGCHAIINPPGFVLERYDAVGSWQDIDRRGGAIDGTADVTFGDGVTKTITSPLQLMRELAASPRAQRRYAEQLVSYATRRAPNPIDACIVDILAWHLLQDASYPFTSMVADYTRSDSFRTRTRGN